MSRQLLVAERAPFGIAAERRRTGIRLNIKTRGNGEELYANLSAAAAGALRDQLTAALEQQAAGEAQG
jgi:hypothetical protein